MAKKKGGIATKINGYGTYTRPRPQTPAAYTATKPAPPAELPPDPIYDSTIGGLTKRRDNTLADLANDQTTGLADFGYSAAFNPDGTVASLQFDPNNPNSRAALLKRHALAARRGTDNSYAAAGQLYSGARLNAQNENDFQTQYAEDRLRKQVGNFLTGIARQKRDTGTDFETGSGQAYGDRLGRLDSNPLYDPASAANAVPTRRPGESPAQFFARANASGGHFEVAGGKWWYRFPDGRKVAV